MSRRKRTRAHSNHERWLVSYADFITLLFAFFVVLYASQQVDQRKVSQLALSIQAAFQQLGVFPASATRIPLDNHQPISLSTEQALQSIAPNTDPPSSSLPSDSNDASQESDISALQSELQQALQHEIDLHSIVLHRETEGLVISLREFGFFDSGSAALKASALPALDRIASILAIRICRLRIEGHTDNVPIHTAQMASNWELSTARSTELVRLLMQRHRIAPERLSAAGYAEYHPVASNATEQGRAQNRRVDIVILNEHIVRSRAREDAKTETRIPANNNSNNNLTQTPPGKPSPSIPPTRR